MQHSECKSSLWRQNASADTLLGGTKCIFCSFLVCLQWNCIQNMYLYSQVYICICFFLFFPSVLRVHCTHTFMIFVFIFFLCAGHADILCIHTCTTQISSMGQLSHLLFINFGMFLLKRVKSLWCYQSMTAITFLVLFRYFSYVAFSWDLLYFIHISASLYIPHIVLHIRHCLHSRTIGVWKSDIR